MSNRFIWHKAWLLIVLISSMLLCQVWASDGESKRAPVVMFSATYCPTCLHARKFFESNKIRYQEFDIETSQAARDYFDKLGGRGTPLIFVKNQRMEGFSEARFWQYYSVDE